MSKRKPLVLTAAQQARFIEAWREAFATVDEVRGMTIEEWREMQADAEQARRMRRPRQVTDAQWLAEWKSVHDALRRSGQNLKAGEIYRRVGAKFGQSPSTVQRAMRRLGATARGC